MLEIKLAEVYSHKAVESFGQALRLALRKGEDYASLVELEYVEKPEEFSEVLKKFLRRYEAQARKYERETGHGAYRPTEKDLDELAELVDKFGPRIVRASLIAHALVKAEKEE